MKIKKILLLIILSTVMATANAGVRWAGHATVKVYYPVGGATTYLSLNSAHINPAGCASSVYYGHHQSYPEFEEYRKLALTAKASGQKLSVYVYDDQCHGSYPKIYSMLIQ